MILKKKVFVINGVERMFMCDPEKDKLSDVIRRLGLTGCKVGCGVGVCGSCSVIINGKVERTCNKPINKIEDYAEITTIEGIGTPQHLHPLQQAWITYNAVQCGFCVPGFIVSAYQLLKENNNPTREQVRDWFQKTKNVCRCTGYKQIVDAVMAAAKVVRGEWTMEDMMARTPKEGEFLGKPLTRPDGLAKVCGLADYGDDQAMKMPEGTLYAAIVQPKITHHAKILAIHTEEAEKFLSWCASNDGGQKQLVEGAGFISPFKSCTYVAADPFAQTISDYTAAGKTSAWHWLQNKDGLAQNALGQVYQDFASGSMDTDGFVQAVQQVLTQYYAS